jgi:hypothetical protein
LIANGRAKLLLSRFSEFKTRLGGSLALPKTEFKSAGGTQSPVFLFPFSPTAVFALRYLRDLLLKQNLN